MDQPRSVIKVIGTDRVEFLQGLVTNNVSKLSEGLVYAALLTPQGKYIADFFLVPAEDAILVDVAHSLLPALEQRLALYRLRADVKIERTDITVARGLGDTPDGAFADPRHPEMGWRAYDGRPSQSGIDWVSHRIAHMIPEADVDLTGDSYILEMGFERLNGVDFKKGCYVGQEVTARMKHKTELRKGLAQVEIKGPAVPGDDLRFEGKTVGQLLSVSGETGLAYLRFDRVKGPMVSRDADVILRPASE